MTRKTSACVLLFVMAIAALNLSTQSAGQTEPRSKPPKIVALLKERRDALKQRLATLEAMSTNPTASMTDVVDAREDFLRSELELSVATDERIALLKSRVANLKDAEEHYKALKIAGKGTEAEVLLAKARRLSAEIDLEREIESQ